VKVSKRIVGFGIPSIPGAYQTLLAEACGSTQATATTSVQATTAPACYLDVMYVGNDEGNDAQVIVSAKKFEDA
jgi:hypothetical protein